MAKLVNEDHERDDEQKGRKTNAHPGQETGDHIRHTHLYSSSNGGAQAAATPDASRALARVAPSSARTSSSVSGARPLISRANARSVRSTVRAIPRKPMRRPRNCSTATSLAALRMVGAAPPICKQTLASCRQGKRAKSGFSKVSWVNSAKSKRREGEAMRRGHPKAW